MTAIATPPTANQAQSAGKITLTTEQLAANLAGRPAEQIEVFERFRKHCALRGFGYETAARNLRKPSGKTYSRDSIYLAMNGHRDASVTLDALCESIDRYLRSAESPAPIGGFIRTRMATEIKTYLQLVKEENMIGTVVGQNACGKTTALEEAERDLPWLSVIRVPEGGHRNALLQSMARRHGLGGQRERQANFANKMMEFYGTEDVIAFDEYDECFRARSAEHGNTTMSYTRRIYDQRGCAIVLVVDPSGYRKLQNVGPESPLRKLASRMLFPLILPPFYREDLDLYASVHGLEPSPEVAVKVGAGKVSEHFIPRVVEEEICGSHIYGLRVWLGMLRRAQKKAAKWNRDASWEDVVKEYALAKFMGEQAKQLSVGASNGGNKK